MAKLHTHPCANVQHGCTNTVPCSGEWVRNHDGYPEIICSDYHRFSAEPDAQPCEECSADTCVLCERVVRWEGHADDCSQQLDRELSPAESATAVTEAFARVMQARETGR